MKSLLKLATLFAFSATAFAEDLKIDNGFTPEVYQKFVDMRVGDGAPVYWYSTGTVRAFPSGELLFNIYGYDTARLDKETSTDTKAVQLSRKVYYYADPKTGKPLETYNGNTVTPIAYPYQLITYAQKDGFMETFVEQGSGTSLRKIGPGREIVAHSVKGGTIFDTPLFLDFELPNGKRMTSFEQYDFFEPDAGADSSRHITFMRFGDAPRWAGGGRAVMHMITWRLDNYEDVPADMRTFIESKAPMWRVPPKDMAEIKALQKGN